MAAVSWRRGVAVASLVAVSSWLAMLVNREWYTLLLAKRMGTVMGSVMGDAPNLLKELVQTLPPSPSDKPKHVILAIQMKMGTTWVGHITHQLVAHGQEIDPTINLQEDSPYPEFAPLLFGQKLHELTSPVYWERDPFASYPDGPVTIRTHVAYRDMKTLGLTEKNSRLVSVFRDYADTVVSMWRFMPTVLGIDSNLIRFESFVRFVSLVGMLDSMFIDYADFWERRHHPNVLLLFYDDLKEDLAGEVSRTADFLALSPPLTSDDLALVVEQSTYRFMSSPAVEARFNDQSPKFRSELDKLVGITEKDKMVKPTGVVRKNGGSSGEGAKHMPEAVRQLLDHLWVKHVLPRTNCTSVEDMRMKFQAERAARTGGTVTGTCTKSDHSC